MPQPTKNTSQDVEMRDTIPKDAERAAAGASGDAGEKKDDEQKEEDPVVAAVNGMVELQHTHHIRTHRWSTDTNSNTSFQKSKGT